MRNCYLSRNYKGVDGAGNKVKDISDIRRNGWHCYNNNSHINIQQMYTQERQAVVGAAILCAGEYSDEINSSQKKGIMFDARERGCLE